MTGARDENHEQWEALAAGSALHALEPDEELAFADHLRDCDHCRQLVADNELVAAQLGSLAHEEPGSAPSWSAMRAGIIGTEQTPAPVVDLGRRRAARAHTRLLGAAAGLVLVAGAAVAVWQTHGTGPTSATRAISSCRHQSGCAVVRLHTPEGAAPAVVLVASGSAKMVPLAMPAAPAGRQYVLWQLLRNGGPTVVATFDSVSANEVMPLSMPYADTAAFAVSIEPAGAAPLQPTKVIAVGNTTS